MSNNGWKVAKSTNVDLESRKKRNAASKQEHERQAKIREYRKKKKQLEHQEKEKGAAKPFNDGVKKPFKGGKNLKNKPKKQKKILKKCEKADKEVCEDIKCMDSHQPCRQGLDCTKKICSLIHKPKILEIPQTKEETLIYLRLIHYIRENALTNGTKPAIGRLTFEKLAGKLIKKQDPEILINVRCDWTWQKYATEFEKEHQLKEGSLSNPEILESDLAQFYEFFLTDLKEHFYTHTKNYELEREVEEEKEEDEEETPVTEFDNNKIDAVLKEAIGKTTQDVVNDFPEYNDEKKLAQEWKCWKYIFQARVLKGIMDLEETEAVLLLDNLIGLVEKGKKENDVVFNGRKFTVDPALLSLESVDCSEEITKSWKTFNSKKKQAEVVKLLNESLGAVPNVPGFKCFPSLLFVVKNHLNIFRSVDITSKDKPTIEDHIKIIKEVYQKTKWSFNLAEFLNKKEGDFLIYETIEEAKNYGPIYQECKQKIQELWK